MSAWLSKQRTGWREVFSIDLRSLALFRVGLGIMLISDLVKRSLTLREHYTGEGVFPYEVATTLQPDIWLFRVYLISDQVEVQALLFGVAALLALCVLVGYRTKLATILSFVLLVSIIRRNPYCTHTGDIWLEALTFWAMFLPLGARFSLDRLRGKAPPIEGTLAFSLGTIGMLLQMFVFYFMAGVLKHDYELWQNGEAIRVFTGIVEYTRPFGAFLGQYPAACRFLTYFTLALETAGPFFFFLPWFLLPLRLLLIVMFAGFHLAIQLSVYIGIFEVLAIVALAQLLPRAFWDELLPRIRVPAALRRAWAGAGAWLKARVGRGREGGEARALPRPVRLAGELLAGFSLLIVLASNLNTVRADAVPIPKRLDDYARHIGLIQDWNIFNDLENLFYGWFLVLGQTNTGRMVDVQAADDFTEIPVPERPAEAFTNHNQRRFWGQAARPGQDWLRFHLARFLAEGWNEEHAGDPLYHIAIFHIASAPGRKQRRLTVRRLWVQELPRPDLEDAGMIERELAVKLRGQWRRRIRQMPRFLDP